MRKIRRKKKRSTLHVHFVFCNYLSTRRHFLHAVYFKVIDLIFSSLYRTFHTPARTILLIIRWKIYTNFTNLAYSVVLLESVMAAQSRRLTTTHSSYRPRINFQRHRRLFQAASEHR